MAEPRAPAAARPPAGRPSRILEIALRSALWLLLGGWVGASMLFAAGVAPTAFRVLPSTAVAGQLVGPILSILHLYGAAAGLALAALTWSLGRGAALALVPVAMSAICLYSHFGVSAEISEIRDLTFGPAGSPEHAARFDYLHRVSVNLFGALGLAAIGLVVAHARADTHDRPPDHA